MRQEASQKNNVTGRLHVILGPQCNWLIFKQTHLRYFGVIKFFFMFFFKTAEHVHQQDAGYTLLLTKYL